MSKFFKNLYRLIQIDTKFFIILKFIYNFLPNYKTKRKSKIIENEIYNDFKSYNEKEKWFCNNLFFLNKKLKKIKNIRNILEIGSYEGRSCIYFGKKFIDAKITCVDTWSGSDEHLNIKFQEIENNFDKNILNHLGNDRVEKQKISSDVFFKKNNKFYDLIYIDGDHQTDQVNKDINNAWSILNDGGYLILDDYTWWWYNDLKKNPAFAINNFIYNNINSIDVENLIIWKQVLIKKKSL
ncbi:class I SAM-dependent methyltransferase [Candidatus Pelagibacter sp.]|uniref:class I SAM-dependent methyltransferase n=1 Tax=Candidatus Pelagibacter sp. TaxID=2024849 RepID=UPI003F877788